MIYKRIYRLAKRFGYVFMCSGGYIGGKYYEDHAPDIYSKLRCDYCGRYKIFKKIRGNK